MPAKSRGKKHYAQKKQPPVKAASSNGAGETVENRQAGVATAARPVVKPVTASATQPSPRRYFVGKELLRILIVSAIVLVALVILAFVLR